MQDRVLGLLGLCQRAGKIKSGEFQTEKSIKEGKARLVLFPKDASENTKKKFRNMCVYRQLPFYEYGTKEILGHAIGREERSSISIEDEGFSKQLEKILDNGGSADVR